MPGYHNLLYLQRLDAKVQEVSEIVTGGRYFKESQTSAKEIHSKIHYREKPSILRDAIIKENPVKSGFLSK